MIHEKLTGRKMKRMCEAKGLTVPEIQERLGIGAHQSVYNWFNGRSMPTLDNYYGLCRMLGVPMESLLVTEDEAAPAAGGIERASGTRIWWTDTYGDRLNCLGRIGRYRAAIR